jgi:hypothetical protein
VLTRAGPTVASSPEWASRAGGPFVIDAFFMWAADNSVRHHDRSSSGCVDELEHFFQNVSIVADIGLIEEPTSKVRDVGILSRNNAHGEFSCCPIVRPIERDRRDRVAAKSSLGSFAQSLASTLNHTRPLLRARRRVSKAAIHPSSATGTFVIPDHAQQHAFIG